MPRRAYAPHEVLVRPGRARPELWRLLAGLAMIAVIAIGLNSALQRFLATLEPDIWGRDAASLQALGSKPLPLIVLLCSFGFLTIGVAVAARQLQGRPMLSVVGPLPVLFRQFWRVLKALLIVGFVIAILPPYDMGEAVVPNLDPGRWLALLPISLLAVLIQTSAEEILFRGYMQQALAARFQSPFVWMCVPAVLFALGHYLPSQSGDNAVLIVLWAAVFGVLMADLTARAGTLGPAIAVHMFNNVTALLIVSVPDSLSGLSLFTAPFGTDDTEAMRSWLFVDFAMMLVNWLAARLAIGR